MPRKKKVGVSVVHYIQLHKWLESVQSKSDICCDCDLRFFILCEEIARIKTHLIHSTHFGSDLPNGTKFKELYKTLLHGSECS